MKTYQACQYEHYHDHGDDAPPTIEWAVYCSPSNTYLTGYKTEKEAENHANKLNNLIDGV